jgi:hypothetical protein
LKLQDWTDLPTTAVVIRVFLELSEKLCAVSGSIGLLAMTACGIGMRDISVGVDMVVATDTAGTAGPSSK